MYLSLQLLLATDSLNPFFSLASIFAIEPPISISNSPWQFWDYSYDSQAPINTKTLKVVMSVMVLISSHEIWSFEREKVERLMRVKDLGFFWYYLALQIGIGCAKFVENGILYCEDMD